MAEHKPEFCVILQRPMEKAEMIAGRDIDWTEAMASAKPADCVPVAATDPLYILYTSGTTGQPKGVVRDNGGHLVALKWTMKAIYDIDAGDVFWAASDVGWVVGHSYIVYAPLFKGATTILFRRQARGHARRRGVLAGDLPAQGQIPVHGAHGLQGHQARRSQCRTDERLRPVQLQDLVSGPGSVPIRDTIQWSENNLKVPVIDHWWQTETGWAIAANCMGLHQFPVKYGSPTKAVPGWNLQVVDANNQQVAPGEIGALVVKLPPASGDPAHLVQKR